MSRSARVTLALSWLGMLFCILLLRGGFASASADSSAVPQAAKEDCTPHWSLNIVTDTRNAPSLLNNVAVVNQDDIWAVGYSRGQDYRNTPLALHWDGVRWKSVFVPMGFGREKNLTGIAALGPDDVWAVGSYGPALTSDGTGILISVSLIEHWDGMQWSIVPSPNPSAGSWLLGVSAIGSKDIWAVGYYVREEDSWERPLALHWDGGDWKQVAMPDLSSPSGSSARLNAVAAIRTNDVWAVGTENRDNDGFGGDSLIMHWDGKKWTEYQSLALGHLLSVTAVSPIDVWAVGFETNVRRHEAFYMKTLIMHWNGQRWARIPSPDTKDPRCNNCSPPNDTLHGIIVVNSKEIWAIGSYYDQIDTQPLALRWDGTAWSIASMPVSGFRYDKLDAVNTVPSEWIGAAYQPVMVPPSGDKCPAPPVPTNPTARVSKPSTLNITYFAAVGHTLRGGFREYWQKHGGLAQFGHPITEEFQEGDFTVQYFERARFEWHPELAPQFSVREDVLASHIAASGSVANGPSAAFLPHPASKQSGTLYFPETMHNMAAQFVSYWQTHGGAAVFGNPISEPFMESNPADGKLYFVQYFPRQRFEYHPGLAEPYRVSLGMVGVEVARQQGWLP